MCGLLIIKRYSVVNKAEFKQIFDTYFNTIRRFLFYRIGNEEKASDMAQDLFLKLWEKRDTLTLQNIKSLLYKMANEQAISEMRKVAVRRSYANSVVYVGEEISAHDQLQFDETMNRYVKALDEMPELQRVTFLLSRNEELKYHEIAEMLEISVKAVEKRMSGALEFLRNRLLEFSFVLLVAAFALVRFLKI